MEKIGFAGRRRFCSNMNGRRSRRLLAILLDPGGSQPRKAVLIDGKLPRKEFIDGQRVTAAGFLKRKQPAANRSNDFGLATDDPPLGSGRGQVRNG
jgi:hypothetical protein